MVALVSDKRLPIVFMQAGLVASLAVDTWKVLSGLSSVSWVIVVCIVGDCRLYRGRLSSVSWAIVVCVVGLVVDSRRSRGRLSSVPSVSWTIVVCAVGLVDDCRRSRGRLSSVSWARGQNSTF